MAEYKTLDFSSDFLLSFAGLSKENQRRVVRALDLLEANERHPSLRVHQLQGNLAGLWSASASGALRITFERLPNGRKRLVRASQHYGD